MPDRLAQYTAATTAVALFDLSDRVQIELCGADRQTFLHNFCTNDIKALQPGQGCEAFLTNIKGRILGHIVVSATDESLWLESVPGSAEFIVSHLDKYLITEDVQINDRTAKVGPLLLVGPQAADWLSKRGASVSDLPLWGQCAASIEGIDLLVRRAGFTLPPAYELVVPHASRGRLQEAIAAGGVPLGDNDVFEALRIEAGFPHFGIDLTDENIAQESGRTTQAISFTKGCYLGQEPIARLDALGHTNKELRVLKLSGSMVPEPGTPVQSKTGDDVGRITSSARSPVDGQSVALAMLKMLVAAPGTEVIVGEASAVVVVHSDEAGS